MSIRASQKPAVKAGFCLACLFEIRQGVPDWEQQVLAADQLVHRLHIQAHFPVHVQEGHALPDRPQQRCMDLTALFIWAKKIQNARR